MDLRPGGIVPPRMLPGPGGCLLRQEPTLLPTARATREGRGAWMGGCLPLLDAEVRTARLRPWLVYATMGITKVMEMVMGADKGAGMA